MKSVSVEILPNLFYMGVNDRVTSRFENMWPLPHGVAYNSYLILDEKNALLDTVCMPRADQFIDGLTSKMENVQIDYLIALHVEPDHSGAYREVLSAYPNIKIVGNKITFKFLDKLFNIRPENFIEVKDGDSLCLGKRTLTFYTTSNCHWPESMVAYENTDKILFSQDIFGSFGTTDSRIFDNEITFAEVEEETRRYFSNIVGKHCGAAVKAINKLSPLEIKLICPVHGKIWRKNINEIVDAYVRWSNYETEKGVVIAYGSMYGTTEAIADTLARYLVEEGIHKVKVYDLSQTHTSYIVSDIWKYNTLVVASPTYNSTIMPVVSNFLTILQMLDIKKHNFSYFSNYGWSSCASKVLQNFAANTKMDVVQLEKPIDINGAATADDLNNLRLLAKSLAKKVNELPCI